MTGIYTVHLSYISTLHDMHFISEIIYGRVSVMQIMADIFQTFLCEYIIFFGNQHKSISKMFCCDSVKISNKERVERRNYAMRKAITVQPLI